MGGQPPARRPDPAHEGLASDPPPCSAITLQSGPTGTHIHKTHCITHQHTLCAKSVVKVVNSILCRSLTRRQFQELVDVVDVLAESRSQAVPCVRPAQGDRHLSSSEEYSLRVSVLRPAMARSSSPTDGRHHNAPERPQPEASGQIHSRNRHALTHHSPRLAACVSVDVEPDTCVSAVTSFREAFASRFVGVRPLHGCGVQAVYRPP